MRDAAADLEFETAARMRDEIKRLEAYDLEMPAHAAPINTEIAATIANTPMEAVPKGKRGGQKSRSKSKSKSGGRGRRR